MSLELFNNKMTETANAIRGKLGVNSKMAVNQFPINVNNIDIYQTETPEILDPVKVREETRPSDWMSMPETINENEIYMLFMIPTGLRSLCAFTVTTENSEKYKVEIGRVENGNFIVENNIGLINSGEVYANEFYGPDWSKNPITSTGFRQIMIKISGAKILTFEPSSHPSKGDENRSGWNVFEISCNIPQCTSFKCGNKALTRALRNLVYFTKVGLSSITDFSYMFSYCNNLKTVIGLIGNSAITKTSYMFFECNSLVAIPNFDISSVRDTQSMFCNCYSLKRIPKINFNTTTNADRMFMGCSSLVYLEELNLDKLITANAMFSGCNNLIEIKELNLPTISNAGGIFANCYKLTKVPFNSLPKAANLQAIFQNCISLTTVEIDVPIGSVFVNMFNGCVNLTSVILTTNNKSSVLQNMFKGCRSLIHVQPFNLVNSMNSEGMFSGCTSLEEDLSWAITVGGFFSNMFENCKSLTEIECKWNGTSNIANTFSGCSSLITVKNFAFSLNPENCFANCYSLSKLTLKSSIVPNGNCTLDLTSCSIGYQAMLDLFNTLPKKSNSSYIYELKITGNRGAVNLTAADKKIATDKGWTLDV